MQDACMSGTVTHRIFLGSSAEYVVEVPGVGDIMVATDGQLPAHSAVVEPGDKVDLHIDPAVPRVFAD